MKSFLLLFVFSILLSSIPITYAVEYEILTTISVGSSPFSIAFDSANDRMYVTNDQSDDVSVINTATNAVDATISVGENPRGIAFDSANNRMYVTNYLDDNVSVINTATNAVDTTISVGDVPRGIAFDSANNRMYVTNNLDDNVSVINTATNAVDATISVGDGPMDIAFDSANNRMYVTNNNANSVSVINTATNAVDATISVGSTPRGIAFDSANDRMYVSNANSNSVSVINTATNAVDATITVGSIPRGIAFDSANDRMYVTNNNADSVSVINTATNAVDATISVGDGPMDIAFDSANDRMYVSNANSNSVSVIDTAPNPAPTGGNSDMDHKTRPTFGLSHETHNVIVTEGFSFNGMSFDITDNWHTDFEKQTVTIGEDNTFSAKVYASKDLKVQEFLFGMDTVGDAHNAELRVEVHYDYLEKISDVFAVQNSNIIDTSSAFTTSEKSKCTESDSEENCITTTITLKFLEPLLYDVMAIKAIDHKGRTQITYLNDGFDISGDSLNPMESQMILGTAKYEGLIKVTQNEKYSKLWTSEDGRVFERNNHGTFSWSNHSFERFTDSGFPTHRSHSEFSTLMDYETKRAEYTLKSICDECFDEPFDKIDEIVRGTNLLKSVPEEVKSQ